MLVGCKMIRCWGMVCGWIRLRPRTKAVKQCWDMTSGDGTRWWSVMVFRKKNPAATWIMMDWQAPTHDHYPVCPVTARSATISETLVGQAKVATKASTCLTVTELHCKSHGLRSEATSPAWPTSSWNHLLSGLEDNTEHSFYVFFLPGKHTCTHNHTHGFVW